MMMLSQQTPYVSIVVYVNLIDVTPPDFERERFFTSAVAVPNQQLCEE